MDDKIHTESSHSVLLQYFSLKWMVICKYGEKETKNTKSYMIWVGLKFIATKVYIVWMYFEDGCYYTCYCNVEGQ
jgi:hypothetical protein